MASQGRQKKINFKIIYRVPVIDMWFWEITTWEIEITFQEWKTSMRDFKLPIEKEKTLHNITLIMEKNTDVTVHREININCWEWESVAKGYGQKLMESAQHFKRNVFFLILRGVELWTHWSYTCSLSNMLIFLGSMPLYVSLQASGIIMVLEQQATKPPRQCGTMDYSPAPEESIVTNWQT